MNFKFSQFHRTCTRHLWRMLRNASRISWLQFLCSSSRMCSPHPTVSTLRKTMTQLSISRLSKRMRRRIRMTAQSHTCTSSGRVNLKSRSNPTSMTRDRKTRKTSQRSFTTVTISVRSAWFTMRGAQPPYAHSIMAHWQNLPNRASSN